MATLEKPKQKKPKKSVPSKSEAKQKLKQTFVPKEVESKNDFVQIQHEQIAEEENECTSSFEQITAETHQLQFEEKPLLSDQPQGSEPKLKHDLLLTDQMVEPEPSTSQETTSCATEDNTLVNEEEKIIENINEQIKNIDIKDSEILVKEQTETPKLTEKYKEETKIDEKISEEELVPTAPAFEEIESSKVQYPTLPLKESSQLTYPVQTKTTLKPFTAEQLAQLYSNPELEASREFVHCFVESELRTAHIHRHVLYELLGLYARAREALRENGVELQKCREELKGWEERAWLVVKKRIFASAQCQDGVSVQAAHDYPVAKLQRGAIDEINQLQTQIRKLANETHTLSSYTTVTLKLKIEHYLQSVINSCLYKYPANSPPVILNQKPQTDLRELRLCISILFSYQRRPTKDRGFINETRDWLSGTVAALMRLADWQDHAYVLCHVLRCPAGIGQWAGKYVQVPFQRQESDGEVFADRYINHAVTVLGILLRSVERREEFLTQINVSQEAQDAVAENLWVLVDSDGEEDANAPTALKENDLVAFMNQIPLADIFRAVLNISEDQLIQDDNLQLNSITEHHILRLFAFCTVVVDILNDGLQTYGTQRYHQFVKRLCRLIRHTLQYASDTWEWFKNAQCSKENIRLDQDVMDRLQLEFDMLFVRCGRYLYAAQGLGAWQFLAVLPFHTVTLETLWKFLYMLHEGKYDDENIINYHSALSSKEVQEQFSEKLCIMGVEESYYLLNTFANMILARSEQDEDFIQFATINLLQIGFIGEATQESCSKCAGILLSNICGRYPSLVSDIIMIVDGNMEKVGQLGGYLFRELPLNTWRPTEADLEIVGGWLLKGGVTSVESCMARLILGSLNWDFISSNILFLPYELHVQTALLLAEFVDRHCVGDLAPWLLESVRQAAGAQTTPEQQAARWAWQLAYRLRLHVTDRGVEDVSRVPDLVKFDQLQKGLRAQQPLCSYLSLMMTTTGHLIPMVCSHGFTQMQVMLSTYRYEAVLVALHSIIPLFISCPESLVVSVSFQNILSSILQADRTYMKMAKSLITYEWPGQMLRNFGCMLEHQVLGLNGKALLIVWAQALVATPNWNKDLGVLYLLDIIVRVAFFDRGMYAEVQEVFRKLLEKCMERVGAGGSGLLSWISVGGQSPPTLLGGVSSQPQFSWLAYLCLDLEHELLEVRTHLWAELLRQLYQNAGKTNVDNSLKKACSIVKVPSFSSSGLCIYRWAQQALDTPLDHPLLPLLWQRFFQLHLCRVPSTSSDTGSSSERGCVGSKFFDGVVNTTFCKRLKRRLQEVAYRYESIGIEDISNEEASSNQNQATPNNKSAVISPLVIKCKALYRAYVLWLEEPLLQEASLYLPSLPPQYEPKYLAHILQGSTAPWMELVDVDQIRNQTNSFLSEWRTLCCRDRPQRPAPPVRTTGAQAESRFAPTERIAQRLASYDKPQGPPQMMVQEKGLNLPTLHLAAVRDRDGLNKALQGYLRQLEQLAELYSLQCSEHIALDSQYKDLLPHLYKTVTSGINVRKSCKPNCSRPATIPLKFTEARINEGVKQQLQTNRSNLEALLVRSSQKIAEPVIIGCTVIERDVDQLCASVDKLGCQSIGAELFHLLIDKYGDEFSKYPPTQQLFLGCINKLGRTCISGAKHQTARLCRCILQQPAKGTLMLPHFNPVGIETHAFLQMYSDIVDKMIDMPEVVQGLLNKLDVPAWLSNKHPRLSDRSQFINLLFTSFSKLNHTPTGQFQPIHILARRHLVHVFKHEFPEHYGEVLRLMLVNSATGTLSKSVWRDLIGVLVWPGEIKEGTVTGVELRQLAANQRILRQEMLVESTVMLGRYFSQERITHGAVYGIYPRYRSYIPELQLLLSYISHSLISAIISGTGAPADRLAEVTFPRLLELWGPWLIPGWPPNAQQHKQGAQDDRALTLPWLQADCELGKVMLMSFTDNVRFMMDALPGNTAVLCLTWQFYATSFANPAVKPHVLSMVHACLVALPWKRFWPSLQDLETMVRVVDQYLPDTHTFLCHIFFEVEWGMWLSKLEGGCLQTSEHPPQGIIDILARAHLCLLHLLVKLSAEDGRNLPNCVDGSAPIQVGGERACLIIRSACQWAWRLIKPPELAQILDWYVMSAYPSIILPDQSQLKNIDHAVMELLRTVSCYDANEDLSPTTASVKMMKRQCFLRACMKLLINCASRHKNLVNSQPQVLQKAITLHLEHLEYIVEKISQNPKDESDVLLTEILSLINNANLSALAVECTEAWLLTRAPNSSMLLTLLRVVGLAVSAAEPAGRLLEAGLIAYFGQAVDRAIEGWADRPNWNVILMEFNTPPPKQPPIEQSLLANGRLLSLHTIVLKRLHKCDNCQLLMDSIIDWLADVKIVDGVEYKLPLLWGDILNLSARQCTVIDLNDHSRQAISLRRFSQQLQTLADNPRGGSGGGWGRAVLGALTGHRACQLGHPGRLLCRALAGYILAQLPDSGAARRGSTGVKHTVRCTPGAPAPVGQPGGNSECAKVLLKMDSGVQELKTVTEVALKQIQDPQNSMHNAVSFLYNLLEMLYSKPYLIRH